LRRSSPAPTCKTPITLLNRMITIILAAHHDTADTSSMDPGTHLQAQPTPPKPNNNGPPPTPAHAQETRDRASTAFPQCRPQSHLPKLAPDRDLAQTSRIETKRLRAQASTCSQLSQNFPFDDNSAPSPSNAPFRTSPYLSFSRYSSPQATGEPESHD